VTDACPCGLPAAYNACCGRYHSGDLHLRAPTPEALMRSRYTAFVRKLRPYLLATWHVSTRPPRFDFEAGMVWLGLTVERTVTSDADHGIVAFTARSKLRGQLLQLQETSRFVREAEIWYYVDGDIA